MAKINVFSNLGRDRDFVHRDRDRDFTENAWSASSAETETEISVYHYKLASVSMTWGSVSSLK